MDKHQLTAAINAAKGELEKLTNETIRPHQSFKMRTHGPIISSIVTALGYYEGELAKLNKSMNKKED